MTSERGCYVYLQLPGTLQVVTCGRYEREEVRGGGSVGRFVYGRSYLARADAVPLDPVHLPLTPGTQTTARLDGIFGALRDSAPDAWGRRVIDRMHGSAGLDEMDYLLHAPGHGAGAISFGSSVSPPAPVWKFNRVVALAEVLDAVRLIEEGPATQPIPAPVADLLEPGSSMGGARPKNVVEDDGALWIAKFPQRGDRWNNAPVEAGMLALAARCGIRVPEWRVERVGGAMVLLVKRFDREQVDGGYLRPRMASALTMLDADESPMDRREWSYLLLADELPLWSARSRADRNELFRRMVFNALITNTDDHPRNHAVVAPGAGWELSPAYDLTPNPMHSLERRDLAMDCGLFGRNARRENLLSGSRRFGLAPDDADQMITEMKEIVSTAWRGEVRSAGGSEADCAAIERAFVYEGFELTGAGY